MKTYDIIIIGGGPAGASAALFLEKKGYRIALLDQARFPRDKVCGEFISPAADDIFFELGEEKFAKRIARNIVEYRKIK